PRERERVAFQVCDAVENVRRHVVVREQDGIALALQACDLLDDRLERCDLDIRKDVAETRVDVDRARCCHHGSVPRAVMLNLSITATEYGKCAFVTSPRCESAGSGDRCRRVRRQRPGRRSPGRGRSLRTSSRNLKSSAGRPPVAAEKRPVPSTSRPCSTSRRKFCLWSRNPISASTV